MSHYAKAAWLLLAAGTLILSACSPQAAPTVDSNAVYTQVAGTVGANLTQAAAMTPSATFTTAPTNTLEATQAPTQAEVSPTVEVTPQPVYTATKPVSPDQAQFVSQSVADNSKMNPGQQFTLTWVLKNTGTTTWNKSYLLRYYSGDQMGGAASTAFSKEVKPNDTVELSLALTAPSKAGTYLGNWVLTNADGVNFFPVYIQIQVGEAPTSTVTVVPSATSAPATATTTQTPTTATTP